MIKSTKQLRLLRKDVTTTPLQPRLHGLRYYGIKKRLRDGVLLVPLGPVNREYKVISESETELVLKSGLMYVRISKPHKAVLQAKRRDTSSVTHLNGRGKHRLHFPYTFGDIDFAHYGGQMVSKRLHNGDWSYWLAIEIIPRADLEDDMYRTSLLVISPEAAGEQILAEALSAMGCDDETLMEIFGKPLGLVEALLTYGVTATIGTWCGPNLDRCLVAARDEANAAKMLFGFYMDRRQNGFGATGWDLVAGNVYGPTSLKASPMPPEDFDAKYPPDGAIRKAIAAGLAPLKKITDKILKQEG